jgi:hypothetical protein
MNVIASLQNSMRLRNSLMKIIFFCILGFLASCNEAYESYDEEFSILTSRNAYEIDRHMLQNGIQQLNYSIDLIYPGNAIDNTSFINLVGRGWTQCHSSSNNGWDSFSNADSSDDPYCQYQNSEYLIKDEKLILSTDTK